MKAQMIVAAGASVLGVSAVLALPGCKTRESLEHGLRDGGDWDLDAFAAVGDADTGGCRSTGGRVAIPGGALVVGNGVLDATGAGALFGLLRPNGAAAWAHLDHPGGALAVHDLPPSDPDAPPPAVVASRTTPGRYFLLYSQGDAPRGADAGRPEGALRLGTMAHADAGGPALALVVARIDGDAVDTVARIPEPRDDSLDADLAFSRQPGAGGLVVWDDDDPFGRFGRIRAAHLDGDGHLVGDPFVLTPDGTDAESPRVVATSAGFVVVYRVRRGEVRDAGLVEDAVEAPGERRAYHWLEAISVFTPGSASAAASTVAPVPRALTSQTAHVGAFTVAGEANADDSLDVIARDDDAPRDAVGGQLLALHLAPNLASPAVVTVLVASGVGSGALSLVSAASGHPPAGVPSIVFSAEDDSARRVSMSGGVVHLEPTLDGADPVVLVPGAAGATGATGANGANGATGAAGAGGAASLVVFAPDARDGAREGSSGRSIARRATSLATVVCP